MIAYLDTNVAIWLSNQKLQYLSEEATRIIRTAQLLVSPMVVLELEYMFDLNRTKYRARQTVQKLKVELEVKVCSLSFVQVADAALDEGWATDPFDRLIVANAKANGFAALLSADEKIATHYPRTIW